MKARSQLYARNYLYSDKLNYIVIILYTNHYFLIDFKHSSGKFFGFSCVDVSNRHITIREGTSLRPVWGANFLQIVDGQ